MRHSFRTPTLCFLTIVTLSVFSTPPLIPQTALALTASFGQPYHGSLSNGVPFPRQFNGYMLRDEDHTYTTPEVVGAMLDAIDAVQKQAPNGSPLYIGDFSLPNGGSMVHHRSHQNGRDVDIGMYAKGNRTLDSFMAMNEENLDVPRTWCFIENLLRSQRVQYIFVDRRIQNLLQDYALAHGIDAGYVDRLFGNSRGSIIQHVRNHVDHMHVRFYTPWSTLAAQVGGLDSQKRGVIEMAQQAYLPKKVFYYAKGSESNLDNLAQSFGVSRRELCRWNNLHGSEVPTPGSCIVFYKRGFEMEPVHLAQTLQPDSVPEAPGARFASLRSPKSVSDAAGSASSHSLRESRGRDRDHRSDSPVLFTYSIKRGDEIDKIAKRNGIDPKMLADANHIKKGSKLQVGQQIKLAGLKIPPGALSSSSSESRSKQGKDRDRERSRSLAMISTKGSKERETVSSRDSKDTKGRAKDKEEKKSRKGSDRSEPSKQAKESTKSTKSAKQEKTSPADAKSKVIVASKSSEKSKSSKSEPTSKQSSASSGSRSAQSKASDTPKSIEPKKAPAASSSKGSPSSGVAKDSKPAKKKGS